MINNIFFSPTLRSCYGGVLRYEPHLSTNSQSSVLEVRYMSLFLLSLLASPLYLANIPSASWTLSHTQRHHRIDR